jgi:hypothetical protein
MLALRIAVALLFCVAALFAQDLPPGTALPVMLGSGLNAKGAKPGQKIQGKLMQEVTLGTVTIKSGAKLFGHIVSASRPNGSGSSIVVQFDRLQDDDRSMALNVSLRAMASSQNVFQAGVPIDANSTYESSTTWVTKQVGGEVVFRGRGYVASDQGKVGTWSGTGVWGKLTAAGDCPGDPTPQQALWIFSTTACGLYGFEDTKLDHAGRTPPIGQIGFHSSRDIDIRGGSGWLLVVNPPAAAPSKSQ